MDSQRVAIASAAPSGWDWDGGGPAPPSGQFPAGLRVLVVDDDPTCLKIIERMLRKCLYNVTTCSRAVIALSILRERKGGFDLVLSDVYMPDMDGFKLLEHIGLEMDLPVIMMSADDGKDVVLKGVTHGACDYLIKPVSMEALKNIWQHVIRKKRNDLKELENSGSVEDSDKLKKSLDDGDNASSGNEGNWKNAKRRKEGKDEEDEIEEREDSSTLKKPRVVWSVDLHQQFVAAVNQLGVDKAVPKKILELMNVPGLTRENVASHLQKYRLYLRRVSVPQHQGRVDTPFSGAPEAAFSSISSLDGFDLQALAVSNQLPLQNLMTVHSGPRRAINIGMDMSVANQIGFFNSDAQTAKSSKMRPAMVQQMTNKHMNLLSGPSTYMEPRQLRQTQQVVHAYGNMALQVSEGTPEFFNLPSSLRTSTTFPSGASNGHLSNSLVMQMAQRGQHISLSQQQNHIQIGLPRQPQSRGQLLNGIAGEHDSRVSSTVGQQMLSTGISGHVLGRTETTVNGDPLLQGNYMNTSSRGTVPLALYDNSQNSCMSESVGSCHPLLNSTGASDLVSTGMIQEAVTVATGSLEVLDNATRLKRVKDVIPNYDIFSELHQSKNQDWKLQNINLSYEAAQHLGTNQSNIDFGSSISAHQNFNATSKDGAGKNTCTARKEIFSIRAEIEHEKVECVAQHNNMVRVENSVRLKAESMPDLSCRDVLFVDDNFPNELMSVIGRQQQEVVGQVEPEFNFDGYSFEECLLTSNYGYPLDTVQKGGCIEQKPT